MNFWQKMKKPILCLAPMADVTDAAFRYIIAKASGKKVLSSAGCADFLLENTASERTFFPDTYVTYTEFVSADGLAKAPEAGREKLLKDLEYSEIERPIVAQFFTSKPEMMEKAAELAVELGFDGVDINMGCPDKSIEKQGAGAALMKNPLLARQLIKAAKQGASRAALAKWGKKEMAIPVSVKTRLGYNKDELETWLPELLAEEPAAIILHARTRKEMSKAPAKWERIKRAVEIRNEVAGNAPVARYAKHLGSGGSYSQPLIIGNGDVEDANDAIKKCEESGADGAMLGRAIFGNPWMFVYPDRSVGAVPIQERIKVLLEHIKLFEEKFGGIKSFAIMKKHFKEYLKDLSLKDLKYKLMRTETSKEAEEVIKDYL